MGLGVRAGLRGVAGAGWRVRQGSGGCPPGGPSHPLWLFFSLPTSPPYFRMCVLGRGGGAGDGRGSVEEVAGNTCFEQMGAPLPQIYNISINGNPFLL